MDNLDMNGAAHYQNDGGYSPTNLVQMDDIYSLPDGSSSVPQNESWGSQFDMSSVGQPWGNPEINRETGVKTNIPLPHRDSGYETMNPSHERMRFGSSPMSLPMNQRDESLQKWQNEGFRYCAMLSAPTAMTRNSEDPTLSYLNKGQAYKLSIMDSKPSMTGGQAKRYRAFVRVTFDKEDSRLNPVACWQLWREARTMNNTSRKEKLPFAVEFAGAANPKFQCQIEQESFDGFCITWTMDPAAGYNLFDISVRLHFLSTDFTRSKGVKGLPIRLCVKTQELMPPVDIPGSEDSEICFCRVQLFRDHGAERKMSNDSGNLNKAIEKLKQKMASSTLKPVAQKRKRGRVPELNNPALEAMRAPKVEMKSSDDGLDSKLVELEHMALSVQPRTILALRGSKEDDPDLYAVHLPDIQSNDVHSDVSPAYMATPNSKDSGSERFTPGDTSLSDNEKTSITYSPKQRNGSMNYVSTKPPTYVACFYVRLMLEISQQVYRAVYLSERTTQGLALAISRKYGLTPSNDLDIFHVSDKDLKILVDDDFVQHIPEGQQMTIQLDENSLGEDSEFYGMRLLY
ncbi:hypothetical protein N7456_009880 [Penicillium angulare]|uniref:Grh/CP2 DB domain-containing protein n=1 Tax=Penicillium angulare TaxID=116970 RepID=A0A9W9K5N5_9EURO|nr:hypothetical protein N7456_009880 [Penicillium angulare]